MPGYTTPYDQYYATPELFGDPYPTLITFFKKRKEKGLLLDLGAGQGRNAIPLADLGYLVTAVDHSETGLDYLREKAQHNRLEINVILDDIYTYHSISKFDVILLDSMFHFYKKDLIRERALLRRIFDASKEGASIVICVPDQNRILQNIQDCSDLLPSIRKIQEQNFHYTYNQGQETYSTGYKMIVFNKNSDRKES